MDFNRRIKSFGFAIKGIATLIKTQENAQLHLIATFLAVFAGFFFKISTTEWCFIILSIILVLMAEALNTAIEFVVDLVSPEFHPLAGKAKDVAAAAVLLTAIGAAIIGTIIFIPKIQVYFN